MPRSMPDSSRQFVRLRSFVHPRYWPTWLGIGGMWLIARLPFSISWIWMGCVLMGLGGIFAAADRRYRRLAAREAAGAGQRVAASA